MKKVLSLLLFAFLLKNPLVGQYVTKVDTFLSSSSGYYEHDGVYFSVTEIPLRDSILQLSDKDFTDLFLFAKINYTTKVVEMIQEEESFIVPQECLTLYLGDKYFFPTFPEISYQLKKSFLKERKDIRIENSCKSLVLSDFYEIELLFDDILLESFRFKPQEEWDKKFFRVLESSNSMVIKAHSEKVPGISSPVKFYFY